MLAFTTKRGPEPKLAPKPPRRVSQGAAREILRQHEVGKSIKEIVAYTGIPRSTVQDAIAHPEIKRPLSANEIEEARQLLRCGSTIRAVALQFGVPSSTLHDAIKKRGKR